MAKRKKGSRALAGKATARKNVPAGGEAPDENQTPVSEKAAPPKKGAGRKEIAAGKSQKATVNPKKAAASRKRRAASSGASLSPGAEVRAGRGGEPRARAQKTGAAVRSAPSEGVPIVGIGASAGGLEAFTQLLEKLPTDTGMAFVMVLHLSHTHKSMLTELLAKTTSMPVSQVIETTPVAADHVYVIPPNMNLSIRDGSIEVSPIDKARRVPMAIDFFFRSLAENRKSRAIGVLLSGTGTDGTLGLTAIKAEGGITFAQDEASARYADMPRSAVRSGSADFVLAPNEIAIEITRIARHPYVSQARGAPAGEEEEEAPTDGLGQIFGLIRAATGVDFSLYKPTTIKRRVSRRMLLHKIDKVAGYLLYLKENPGELGALYQDLLINVTSFFRDAETFQFLREKIIPRLVAPRPGDAPVRAWIPGCATGEEAYSVAICLLEALSEHGPNPPPQIFATDVSQSAIKQAREGFYPENIAIDVSAERLRRFFVKTEGGYQISKQVRNLFVFAPQNLVKDPPFSSMDLISCRNVLIYFGTALQRRVLATFHYALKPGGFLMLGGSETTSSAAELFEQVSKKHKVYAKVQTATRVQFDLPHADAAWEPRGGVAQKAGRDTAQAPDISNEADRIVLARYSPPGVVVNSALEIVQFRGHTSRFLEPSPGEASLNLFRMARPGLAVDLRAAVHQARKSGGTVRKEGLQVQLNGETHTVDLEAIPLSGGSAAETSCLILFDDVTARQRPAAAAPELRRRGKRGVPSAVKEVQALRKELTAVQEDLHSIIEEQEASNEELQSANEEILSANEELQSTNEEMETAKEELQATNEELTTVNEELQNRNAELSLSNNDLQNLIAVSDVVMVMVGQDLRIRRITPTAQNVLNLIPTDVGRPLSNIKTNLKISNLENLITEVIDRITPIEREVQDLRGRWHSMRIRPYRTEENKIDGAVMVLVDVDAIKRGEESEGVWRALVDPLPDFILSAEPLGKVLFLNRTMASLAKQVTVGENIHDFVDPKDHASLTRCLQKVIASGKGASFESRSVRRADGEPNLLTQVSPIKSQGRLVALTMTTLVSGNTAAAGRQR